MSGWTVAIHFCKIPLYGIYLKWSAKLRAELGELEAQAIAYSQSRRQRLVAAGDLVRALMWTPVQERKVLSRLARKGLIARVRRGLYLAPSRLPIGGRWNPGEALALTT